MKNAKYMEIHKGDIVFADLGETIGSEQSGIRPVIVIQNDVGNKFSPTVIVAPLTSKQKVTFTSSNKKVAAVNSKGVITAKKKGTATITIKSGKKSVKIKIKVK